MSARASDGAARPAESAPVETRPFGRGDLRRAALLGLAAFLLDIMVRHKVRDLMGLMTVSGVYGLLKKTVPAMATLVAYMTWLQVRRLMPLIGARTLW